METTLNTSVNNQELRELVWRMILDGTVDNLQNYHNSSFTNLEVFEEDDIYLSMKVTVDTELDFRDEVTVIDVNISDVDFWIKEDKQEITDTMFNILNKEMKYKINNL